MPVERVDYYSDDEYEQALAQEAQEYQVMEQREPDVVPCFGCGSPMYEIARRPQHNICSKCEKKNNA